MILEAVPRMSQESCPAMQALGRIVAAPVISTEPLPSFDNSAMDGFSLPAPQGLAAGMELDVAGTSVAGDGQATPGADAQEIMTGAYMPEGHDVVVPLEQTTVLVRDASGRPRRIRLHADVIPGQHCRQRGEDVAVGQKVINAGDQLLPQHLMLLASIGASVVQVARQPRIAIIGTGHELVPTSESVPIPGRVRDSNGLFLEMRSIAAGAVPVHRETVDDDPEAFRAALARALEAGADVVMSTGAVSMGVHDFVPTTLQALGARILFHKVAMRPGKPLLFARLSGGQLYFGLPGNPVSSAVTLRFFVEPALRAMLGMPPEQPLLLPLARAYRKDAGMQHYLSGAVRNAEGGGFEAWIHPRQEPFRILPMLDAGAWIIAKANICQLDRGDLVQVFGQGHLDGLRIEGQRASAVQADCAER